MFRVSLDTDLTIDAIENHHDFRLRIPYGECEEFDEKIKLFLEYFEDSINNNILRYNWSSIDLDDEVVETAPNCFMYDKIFVFDYDSYNQNQLTLGETLLCKMLDNNTEWSNNLLEPIEILFDTIMEYEFSYKQDYYKIENPNQISYETIVKWRYLDIITHITTISKSDRFKKFVGSKDFFKMVSIYNNMFLPQQEPLYEINLIDETYFIKYFELRIKNLVKQERRSSFNHFHIWYEKIYQNVNSPFVQKHIETQFKALENLVY